VKTAVIVAGVCRFTDISHSSWTLFPDADWYLSTWDITQRPYSNVVASSHEEITAIEHLFKQVFVLNYYDEFLKTDLLPFERSFILLSQACEHIKDQRYERIVYFRPDLMLYKLDNFDYIELTVNDNCVKILDIHEPEFTVRHREQQVSDLFFIFSWQTFIKYINNRSKIVADNDVHRSTYKFFVDNNVEMQSIINLRSCLLRDNIYDNLHDLSWLHVNKLFHDVYNLKGRSNKFPKDINLQPDFVKASSNVAHSRANLGILKLRK
jgi:hypothetical protein